MVVSEGAINNIMGGMENTAGVRLHSHRHKLKQRFDIIRKLGQGTYGKVQLAINKETGQEVAIKTIKKAKIETEQDLVRIRREIQIMSSVQHPQIIHIYEVFENREKMVLVMEYAAGGELYDYLSERKVLNEPEARRIFRQVASAVYYCHKHKICHRDLKLENILLDLDGNAKIADFGLSNVFDEKHRLDTFCGSPLYASPEIVKGTPYIGPEVDCWSLGVLLYTLVYGAMPFDGSNFRRLVKQITQGDFYEPATPANASELIRHMLTVQGTERASIENICSHWWVNETYAESCLTEAEALASQTPVRLDLLLSLAPKHISSEHLVIQPDDEDLSQRSDTSQAAPPDLHLPPPPPMEVEMENEVTPARSQSLGSLPPGSRMDIDILLEKKRIERKTDDDKKRRHEETPQGEKKKKKDSISKKPPSRPSHDDVAERKKSAFKEEEERRKRDEEFKSTRKREPSIEKDLSEKSEKKVSKKTEPLVTRKPSKKKESKDELKAKVSNSVIKTGSKSKVEDAGELKGRGASNSRGVSTSPTPSTDATLKASDSSISRVSVSPVKVISGKEETCKSQTEEQRESQFSSVPKVDSFASKKSNKSGVDTFNGPSEPDTDKILIETAAKIEKEEKVSKTKQEETPPSSLQVTTSAASTPNSVTSSQATTPARSRTGSESSTEARPSRSDSSRRQSKIFSKAAMFDNIGQVQDSKSPPPVDKPKKVSRPGALNMSDLAKKFEEKQTTEKKNKVVAPFKVSDARKAFEAKVDKSTSEISPRRKVSVGNSSGAESQSTSPRESLPTSPRGSLPTSPRESLPTSPKESLPNSPRESLPASPRESLPTSPTRGEKSLPTSPSSSTTVNKILDTSSVVKSRSQISAPKEPSPIKEKITSPKDSPLKRITKSPSKEVSLSQLHIKKEKSPVIVPNSSIKKESLPATESAQNKPVKVLSTSKVNDVSKRDVEAKDKLREKTEKVKPVIKIEPKVSKETPSFKPVTVDKQRDEIKARVEAAHRVIEVKVDTSDSSDSESEAEKLLKFLSEKRERLEQAKKEKLKKVSESREKEASARDMPPIKEEPRTTPPSKSPDKIRVESQTESKEKCATLPRGFKSKVVQKPIVTATRTIPTEDSKANANLNKKSQAEIVFNTQPVQKKAIVNKPLQSQKSFDNNKKSSFSEILITTPNVKEPVRLPEYRTEVRHTVCAPETRSAPSTGVEPQLHRAKRERIIPIMLEDDSGDDKSTFNDVRPTIQPSSSSSSKASSASSMPSKITTTTIGSHSNAVGGSATERGRRPNEASPDLLRKSRRERIIPIAVEGEGILTPQRTDSTEGVGSSFQRRGSGQSSFNRGRGFMLDRNESFSSAGEDDDEDEEDGFQILTAESLFSTLLNRVRSLTRKMTDEGSRSTDRMRRTPQPPLNDATQAGGFWSSLYSVPRESPARRISETLSRAQSREDSFGGFASPVWGGRSMSRDGSDAETVFSEGSGAPFSTLPRGWRSRQSGKEGTKEQESVDVSSSTTPNRRQFYSRTLSRDLPIKSEQGNSQKSQGSLTSSPLRASSSAGKPIHKFEKELSDKTPSTISASKPSIGSASRRPHSTAGNSPSSGEVLGKVGGQFEQREPTFNFVAKVSSPSEAKFTPSDYSKGNESVRQLKDLVQELESVADENVSNDMCKEGTSDSTLKNKEKCAASQPVLTTSIGKINLVQQTIPSKSITSFQNSNAVPNSSGSSTNSTTRANITILQPNWKPADNHAVTVNDSPNNITQLPANSLITGASLVAPPIIIHCHPETEINSNNLSFKVVNLEVNQTAAEANTSMKTESNTSKAMANNINETNLVVNARSVPNNAAVITSLSQQPTSAPTHKNGQSNSSWYVCSSYVPPVDQTRRASTIEKKNFLTVEPYRRGKSEDLKAAIELANRAEPLRAGSDLKPYRRSKSRDITPAIEAASERFTQLNSSTLKRISPFEAYRRSKSKELSAAIDQANSLNSGIYRPPVNAHAQSPPPFQNQLASFSAVSVNTPFEKAKTSLEYKLEKAKSPTQEVISGLKIENDVLGSNKVLDKEQGMSQENSLKEKCKEPEKPKSVYKIITSKFTRSLSNLGEDSRHSPSSLIKEPEDEMPDKDEKFKLKRPSRFLKTKEKSSSRSNISEVGSITEEEEMEKNEKKSTSKLSNALNKFLGRRPDEIKVVKPEDLTPPTKSTSAAVISEKQKKPPRFRAKKFSKSQEFLNEKLEEDDDELNHVRAKSVFPEDRSGKISKVESDPREVLCNHISETNNINTTQIGNIPQNNNNDKSVDLVTSVPSLTSYGLSPALASRRVGRQPQLDFHLNRVSSVQQDSLTLPQEKKYSSDFSEDGSITPTDLEDINEDESVMDRITRKSYYSRFNEVKRKPKVRRVDSKEAMDQQLAAAKARLKIEDEVNLRAVRESMSPARVLSPNSYTSISPPPTWEGVTRRMANKPTGPRTTSLPPDDGHGYYMNEGRSNLIPTPESRYRNIQSPPREDHMLQQLRQSVEREEPFMYYRSPSAPLQQEPVSFRRGQVTREEVPNYQRLSSITRDEAPSHLRQSLMAREPHVYHRLSSVTREEPPESQNLNNRRLSSVPRDDVRFNRYSTSVKREEVPAYHTLQYRKSSIYNDEPNEIRYISPSVSESGYLSQKNFQPRSSNNGTDFNENRSVATPTSRVDSNYRNSRSAVKTPDGKEEGSEDVMTAAMEAGRVAGSAAAEVVEYRENIPSPTPLRIVPDPVAVMSAREELTRRLTPLTRLSNMGGTGDSNARPYRRTVTSSILPNSPSNNKVPGAADRPAYKRTHTLDLPTVQSRPVDYGRIGLQDPSRRFSGIRTSDQQSVSSSPLTSSSSLYRRSSFSPASSYTSYVPSSASYSSYTPPSMNSYTPPSMNSYTPPSMNSYTPPSMNTILRRNALYRY